MVGQWGLVGRAVAALMAPKGAMHAVIVHSAADLGLDKISMGACCQRRASMASMLHIYTYMLHMYSHCVA